MKVGSAFLQTFGSQLLQSLASIATGVLIARGLGPAGQGSYATFAAGVALGAFLTSLGQFHGNVLAAANRQDPLRILLIRAVLHGSLILIVLLGTATWWHGLLPGGEIRLAILFSVVLSLEAISQMVGGINLGRHHVTGWNLASITQRLAYFIMVTVLALRLGLRLEAVVSLWAIATAISVILSSLWVWRNSPPSPFSARNLWDGWYDRLGQGARPFFTVGVTLLLVRADIWMLRPMLGVATVGQVSVATYLAEWLWYVPSILGNLLFAVVAADRGPRTVEQVARSARLITTLLVPTMLVLLIVGRLLVQLVYGPAYHEAGVLFTILLPGMTALGIHLVIDAYFAGCGFPPITMLSALGALVAKVGLNLLVIPRFGAEGAAATTSLVYIGLLIVKVVGFRRATGTPWTKLLILGRTDVDYLRDRARAFSGA